MIISRPCGVCGDEFTPQRKDVKYCSKRCRGKSWRLVNPEGYKTAKRRNGHAERLRKKYGLTVEQYDEMVRRQHGMCAICGHAPLDAPLVVDHDHDTGAVRSLLCASCNSGIGFLRDDADLVERAAAYLRDPR